jgi:alkylhydroperoxidase/carboxymuconolactone decarboxylase family protein YurZ
VAETGELDAIVKHFPDFWQEAGHLFTETLYEEVQLDRVSIELTLCSLLAAERWELGVRTHVARALEFGATPDQVRGAILLSMAVAGTSAAVTGLTWAEDVILQAV